MLSLDSFFCISFYILYFYLLKKKKKMGTVCKITELFQLRFIYFIYILYDKIGIAKLNKFADDFKNKVRPSRIC